MGIAAGAGAAQIDEILEEKKLKGAFNPVLLDYLLEEGAERLPEAQRLEAIDQIVAALKADIDIQPGEQRAAALASAGGALAELLGGDAVAAGGAAARGAAFELWESWVDSAFVLQRAGYRDDALAFFEHCVAEFPYLELQGRCALGLAKANPDGALDIVMALLDEPSAPVVDAALRILGDLARSEAATDAQRDQIFAAHKAHLEGLKKSSHGEAAIDGLVRSRDPRAVPLLQNLTRGFMNASLKPAAQRGLLLTFDDRSVVPQLEKTANAGSLGSTADPWEKHRAGVLLLRAGEEAGYGWAAKKLTKKQKKGLAKRMSLSADEPDLRPQIVDALVEFGDGRALGVLQKAIFERGSWLETRIAIAFLELGDSSRKQTALRAFSEPDWGFTQIRLAETLAAQGNLSGIPAISRLGTSAQSPGTKKRGFLKTLAAGSSGGAEAAEQRRKRLRIAVARALSRIDSAEGVPVLVGILDDKDSAVAATAAYGLARMSIPEVVPGLRKAMTRDYRSERGQDSSPLVWATVVRRAANTFGSASGYGDLIAEATQSREPTVAFLALAVGVGP
ncbi:MAG: HEAT repeat domain-containing protein [Acidobacteriota bacterium]